MIRWVLMLSLCACGGKRDDSKPTGDNVALAKRPATPLEEARQLLVAKPKRDPEEWVALAHAQAVAKDPAAKQTLADAVSAARADQLDGSSALLLASDVALLLGDTAGATKLVDDGIAALTARTFPEDKVATLLLLVADLQNPDAVKRVAKLAVAQLSQSNAVISHMRPSGPAWDAAIEAAASLDPHERGGAFLSLARQSRRTGVPAPQLAMRGAGYVMDGPDEWIALAYELVLSGDTANAKPLVEKTASAARSQEAAPRALTYAALATLAIAMGDAKGADAFEKKALQAEEAAHEELEEDDGAGGKAGDPIWGALAIVHARKKDVDGALALVKAHLKGAAIDEVAYGLVEQGERDAAQRVIDLTTGEQQFDLVALLVELEVDRGELEPAKQRVQAAPMHKGARAGVDHLLRHYALAGDVKTVQALAAQAGTMKAMQIDVFTDLAARMLARQGKCDEAIAATKDVVVNRAMCLAVIARYCPNSKL